MPRPVTEPRRTWTSPLLTALAVLSLAACGGSGDPAGPNGQPPPPPPPSTDPVATTSVEVRDNLFDPAAIRVSTGATVTWTWAGSTEHNVTWVEANLSNSPTQSSGTFDVAMPSAPGQLVYFCTLHGTPTSGMRGTITIE